MTFLHGRRPSPAIIISTIALFVALGGSAYAVSTINGSQLKNRSVAAVKLKRHTITGAEVNMAKLGKVPSATKADVATRALKADTATQAANASNAFSAINAGNATQLGHVAASGYQQSCRLGAIAAHVYVKGNAAFSSTYTTAGTQDSFNCTGGIVEVKRTAAGVYDVHFAGLDNGLELIAVGNQSVDPAGNPVNGGEVSFKLILDAGLGKTVYQVRLDNTAAATVDNEFSFALLSSQ